MAQATVTTPFFMFLNLFFWLGYKPKARNCFQQIDFDLLALGSFGMPSTDSRQNGLELNAALTIAARIATAASRADAQSLACGACRLLSHRESLFARFVACDLRARLLRSRVAASDSELDVDLQATI